MSNHENKRRPQNTLGEYDFVMPRLDYQQGNMRVPKPECSTRNTLGEFDQRFWTHSSMARTIGEYDFLRFRIANECLFTQGQTIFDVFLDGPYNRGIRFQRFRIATPPRRKHQNRKKVLYCRLVLEQSAVQSAFFSRQVQTVQRFLMFWHQKNQLNYYC